MKFKEFDAAKVNVDIPEFEVRAGDICAVVEVFTKPREAYEVEFLDAEGYTKAVLTLEADQLDALEGA
jgi:hypothetical protein